MDRRDFINQFALPILAGCAACLASCKKTTDEGGADIIQPVPNPQPPLLPFTVDLQTNLLKIGDSFKKNGVIIVRMAAGNLSSSFIAFQSDCTHAAGTLAWNSSQGLFVCLVHGSTFSANGIVTNGPAVTALKSYTITINGNLMTISQ